MSLDKAIASGREHRKPYQGAQAVDPQCRCGGSCEWCYGNRMYKNLKRLEKMLDRLEELCYNEDTVEEREEMN